MEKEKDILVVKKSLEVLDDLNRLHILSLLKQKNKLCVCEILNSLDLPQNLVSYHLKVLYEAGLVDFQRSGKRVFYFIDLEGMSSNKNILQKIFKQ